MYVPETACKLRYYEIPKNRSVNCVHFHKAGGLQHKKKMSNLAQTCIYISHISVDHIFILIAKKHRAAYRRATV